MSKSITQPLTATPFEPTSVDKSSEGVGYSRLLVWFVIASVGSILLFILLARYVYVDAEPIDGSVALDGRFSLSLGKRYLAIPGEYRVAVRREGYFDVDDTVSVSWEPVQNFHYRLEKLPGSLSLSATDNAGGLVYMNGRLRGRLPLQVYELEAGAYRLRVTSDGYLPYDQELLVEGMGTHQDVELALIANGARLSVESTPAGATFLVNGKELGATPFKGVIPPGSAEFILQHTGYKPWKDLAVVRVGDEISLGEINLLPAAGVLDVTSTPSGAAVTLNDEYRGTTPLSVEMPDESEHQIEIYKDGYQRLVRRMSIAKQSKERLIVELARSSGDVVFQANLEDAEVIIDQRSYGKVNQTVNLPTRVHQVLIRKTGYRDFVTSVTPREGVEQLIRAELVSLQSAASSLALVTKNSIGMQLKLLRPTETFRIGAPRREQGRQANEVERTIKLSRPFYVATHEVTNTEFKRYLPQHSSGRVGDMSLDQISHPAVNLSWEQAAGFCNWLSLQEGLDRAYEIAEGRVVSSNLEASGYRLPTEVEWAYAARYSDQGMVRYTWGDSAEPLMDSANIADESAIKFIARIFRGYNDRFSLTAPVGSFTPNQSGLFDMSGNVAEWVHDFYEVKVIAPGKVETDPSGAERGRYHVVRGSGWKHATVTELRLSFRDYSDQPRNDLGFRVVKWAN
jgi:formylglycine-generating enzyme required for sulfatase activity